MALIGFDDEEEVFRVFVPEPKDRKLHPKPRKSRSTENRVGLQKELGPLHMILHMRLGGLGFRVWDFKQHNGGIGLLELGWRCRARWIMWSR